MKIFDGLNSSRPDKSTYQNATHEDYWALTSEIQKLQAFVAHMSQNLEIMPDLAGTLQAAKDKIEELQCQLEKLAIPEDVMARLEELEKSHLQLDSRAQVAHLAHKNEQTKAELQKSQLQVARMQEEFITEVRGFQNKIWGALNEFKVATKERLEALEAKVEQLSTGVELNALLAKLKG
jgi:outer membrane murein-binding lipoprotein Lpp